MSCTTEYIEYVCEQLHGCGEVRAKKMFGEYMVYVDDKPLLMVCDDTVYVRRLPCLDELLADAEAGYPYDTAKLHHIVDIDDRELTARVVQALLPVIPIPSKKARLNRSK